MRKDLVISIDGGIFFLKIDLWITCG